MTKKRVDSSRLALYDRLMRHEPDWDTLDTYWAGRGGYYSGLEGRAKSTNPHDYGSPARYVFDSAWAEGNDRRVREAKSERLVLPSTKSNVQVAIGIGAAVIIYLVFLYVVFEVLT